ncbi:hypothetical protein M422DRAFT_244352 [Sphaerobolus stellatus SS14]|nr:hypothetical protein M422DRAFT_244352 [Sphaerobolus stellatus SS14]
MTIPVRETTIHCLNLALSDGATKGKLKIYNLATIPARYLECGGRTSVYLHVKDDTRGLPSRFFSVIEITNSRITKLGDHIHNCQINGCMPKIITNHLHIDPKLSSLPILDGELCEADITLVTFTVGFYPWEETESELKFPETPKSPRKIRREGYTTALSFNIQNVVLLYREEPAVAADDEEEDKDTLSDEPLF